MYTCKLDDLLPCTMHDSSVAPSTKILPLKYGPVFTTTSDWLPRHRIVLPATVKATFCYSFHFSPLNCLNCWFLPLSTVNLYYYSFSPCWRRDFPSLSLSLALRSSSCVSHWCTSLPLSHTRPPEKSERLATCQFHIRVIWPLSTFLLSGSSVWRCVYVCGCLSNKNFVSAALQHFFSSVSFFLCA